MPSRQPANALTHDSNQPKYTMTDTLINTIKHLESESDRGYGHDSVIGTSSQFDTYAHFDHDQRERSRARQTEEVARRERKSVPWTDI